MPNPGLVTLTTDFGLADHFVGVMKGVILAINPVATLVDLTHEVPPFDILEGAYTLAQSCGFFPPGTIHLVVVDPGVGSSRRPILAATRSATFVAPDNGVLSMIYAREKQIEVREIDAYRYALKPTSSTFHGRDIFAPVAAWLSKGVPEREMGKRIQDYVQLSLPLPRQVSECLIEGAVLKVDRFGNLITNLTPGDVPQLFSPVTAPFRIVVHKDVVDKDTSRPPAPPAEARHLVQSFSEGSPGEPFVILGSAGYLEIGINQGSAAAALSAKRGSRVSVEF